MIKPEIMALLTAVSKLLTAEEVTAYLVGGFLRDLLLGRDTADIDIAVTGDATEVATRVASAIGGKYVLLDEINQISRVIVTDSGQHRELDFSTLRGDIEQDLAQRDFTIDALAVKLDRSHGSLESADILDPLNGRQDLSQRLIRATGNHVFTADAARLLRAVRLAAELGFTIDSNTEALIRRHAGLLAGVAMERVREELLRLFDMPNTGKYLHQLERLGLLQAIIPELAAARGSTQPKEHFWDVFDHSIETVDAVDFLLRRGKWVHTGEDILADSPWSPELYEHFNLEVSGNSNRRLMLKIAALLHDVAKPQTKTIQADGRMRFLRHAEEGAAIAAGIMTRLRFSTRETKLVETIVKHHLRPGQLSNSGLPSHRAIYRYFRDTGDVGIDILFICLADHLATRGPQLDKSKWQEHNQVTNYVLNQRFQKDSLITPPSLIDGHDIIKILGIGPGPRIGELLETIREAQADGEVTTREQALAMISDQLNRPISMSVHTVTGVTGNNGHNRKSFPSNVCG